MFQDTGASLDLNRRFCWYICFCCRYCMSGYGAFLQQGQNVVLRGCSLALEGDVRFSWLADFVDCMSGYGAFLHQRRFSWLVLV